MRVEKCAIQGILHVQMILLRRDLLVELGNVVLLADVRDNGDNLTGYALAVGLHNGVELLLGTSDDVDLGCKVKEVSYGLARRSLLILESYLR